MLQQESLVKIGDNSGLVLARVIKVLGKRKRFCARLGDVVLVTSQKWRGTTFKKGKIMRALVVNTRSPFYRKSDGTYIRFMQNTVLLVNKVKEGFKIEGTKINVPIPAEILPLLTRHDRSVVQFVI